MRATPSVDSNVLAGGAGTLRDRTLVDPSAGERDSVLVRTAAPRALLARHGGAPRPLVD